jgi:hypothetical protein
MNMDSLRDGVEILAEHRGNAQDYEQILRYVANLHHLPEKTVNQLVLCHLADNYGPWSRQEKGAGNSKS